MNNNQLFNRRDFLKLLLLLPPAYYLPKSEISPSGQPQSDHPNIIIIIFDAWSASNISLYGYPRKTTPFLEKLADQAIVYHNHYAAANWTYPGTTGLLTGVHNWTNRVETTTARFPKPFKEKNLFNLFQNYYRISYTQNQVADKILRNMASVVDVYRPRQDLYLNGDHWLPHLFWQDIELASVAWVRTVKKFYDGYANSLFLSNLYNLYNKKVQQKIAEIEKNYPMGLPVIEADNHFNLEVPLNWIVEQTSEIAQPFLGYFHLYPPHDPYNTRREFYNTFLDDGYHPIDKPEHLFSTKFKHEELAEYRRAYDEYILLVDSEFNRLYQMLAENNTLENTWLILTSDHGELFERGIRGHLYPSFNNPLVHIPLLIFPPGQKERIDVYTPTSAIDLIPTLLHLSNKPQPDWLEGKLLPPYDTAPDPLRPIFSMAGTYNNGIGLFDNGTIMVRKGNYKLTYFFGNKKRYKKLNGEELFELYDLKNDPEELDNLYEKQPQTAQQMRETMFAAMEKHGVR